MREVSNLSTCEMSVEKFGISCHFNLNRTNMFINNWLLI